MIIHASTMERRFRCPGSLAAEDGLPELTVDPISQSGQRIHLALKNFFACYFSPLNYREMVLKEREENIFNTFSKKVMLEIEDNCIFARNTIKVIPELELPENGDGICGTADLVIQFANEKWAVWDYKTGYAKQIQADKNLQLRTYIVKLDNLYDLNEITGHIYSAGDVGEAKFSSVLFSEQDINAARCEIYSIRDKCHLPDAKRSTGEWCQYCRANGNVQGRCPESLIIPQVPAIAVSRMTPELAEKVAPNLLAINVFMKAAKAYKAYIKHQLETNPDSIPNVALKPGKSRRSIESPQDVFALGLREGWFDQETFVSQCVNVPIGELVDVVKENLGVSLKEADSIVTAKLQEQELIQYKQDDPILEISTQD